MGYDVTWNDRRAELADYVQLKYERGAIQYAPGDAFEIDLPHLFDAALIAEIIEHTAHPDQFLARIAALVRPGGYIIMTTPNGAYFRNHLPKFSECSDPTMYEEHQFKPDSDGHIFLLHPEEIEPLAASAGLVLEKFALMTNPFTSGHMKTRVLLRATPQTMVKQIENLTSRLPGRLDAATVHPDRRAFPQTVVDVSLCETRENDRRARVDVAYLPAFRRAKRPTRPSRRTSGRRGRSTRQGFPAATTSLGRSAVTTEQAPTMARAPIVTPGMTKARAPRNAPSPIVILPTTSGREGCAKS